MKARTLTIKRKLAATGLFSMMMIVGGGYFSFLQHTKVPERFNTPLEPEPDFIELKTEVIPMVRSFNSKSPGKGKVNNIGDNIILNDLEKRSFAEATDNNSVASSGFNSSRESRFRSTSRRDFLQHSATGGSSAGFLASGGKSGSGSVSLSSGSSGGSSFSTQQQSFVPFAGSGTGGKNALPDPGFDPDKNTMIPVGDGLWLLLLMSLGYAVIKKTASSNSPS